MNIGESWVAHPLFQWLMIVLAGWVGFATIAIARNWVRIVRLERHKKLLPKEVENIVIQTPEVIGCEEECPGELRSGEERIRTEEPATATIEEADENGNDIPVIPIKNTERENVRSA